MSEPLIAGARKKSDDRLIRRELRREALFLFRRVAEKIGRPVAEVRRRYKADDEEMVTIVEAFSAERAIAVKERLGIEIDWDKIMEWVEIILKILSMLLMFI